MNVYFKEGQNLTLPPSLADVTDFVGQVEAYFFKVLSTRYPSLASLQAEDVRSCESYSNSDYGTYGLSYQLRCDIRVYFSSSCDDLEVLPTADTILTVLASANWNGFVETHAKSLSGNVFQKVKWLTKYSQSYHSGSYGCSSGTQVAYSSSATKQNDDAKAEVVAYVEDSFYDFDFFGGVKARQPTEEEAAGLIKTLGIFFTELLFNTTDSPSSARVLLENVEYCLGSEVGSGAGYHLRMIFDMKAEFGVGCRSAASKEEIISTLRGFDKDKVLNDYVWKSEPLEENLFHTAKSADYNSTRLCKFSSVSVSDVAAAHETRNLPSVVVKDIYLEIGFARGTLLRLRDPVEEEILTLVEQAELFWADVLGKAYDFPRFFLRFTVFNAKWCYVEPQDRFQFRLHFDGNADFDFGETLPSEDQLVAVMQESLASASNFTVFYNDYLSKIGGPSNSYGVNKADYLFQSSSNIFNVNAYYGPVRARVAKKRSHRCGLQ